MTAPRQTTLVRISRALSKRVTALRFADPVRFVYNPLDYAPRRENQSLMRQKFHLRNPKN